MLGRGKLPVAIRPLRNRHSRFKSPATSDSEFSEPRQHIGKWTGRTRGKKPIQPYNVMACGQEIDDDIEELDMVNCNENSHAILEGTACNGCRDRHIKCVHRFTGGASTMTEVQKDIGRSEQSARAIQVNDLWKYGFPSAPDALKASATKALDQFTGTKAKRETTDSTDYTLVLKEEVKPDKLKLEQLSPRMKDRTAGISRSKADAIIEIERKITGIQNSQDDLTKDIRDLKRILASVEQRHANQSLNLGIALTSLADMKQQNDVHPQEAGLSNPVQGFPSANIKARVIDLEDESTDSDNREDSGSSVEGVGQRFSQLRSKPQCGKGTSYGSLLSAFTSRKEPTTRKHKREYPIDSDFDSDGEYRPDPVQFNPKRSHGSKRLKRSAFN